MEKKKRKRRKQLVTFEKQEIEVEAEEIIHRIKQRHNVYVYATYLDLKKLIDINIRVQGRANRREIAQKTGMALQVMDRILKLDLLEDRKWIERIDIRIILLVVNSESKVVKNQEEYFNRVYDHGISYEKIRLEIESENVRQRKIEKGDGNELIFTSFMRDYARINQTLTLCAYAHFNKKEKKEISKTIDDLVKDLKRTKERLKSQNGKL